jgi:hypothetical protein
VLGILIALQINNWNEWKKERAKEEKILEDLVENLQLNENALAKFTQEGFKRDSLSSEIIIYRLEHNLPYHDSLDLHFAYALNTSSEGTILSYVGYESLRNVGFDIIQDKTLKMEVMRLFELTYKKSQERNNRVGQVYAEVQKLKHERLMRRSGFKFAPMDYETLVNDQQFLSWLHTIKSNREWINHSMKESLLETRRLLELIKGELEH